MNGDSSSGASRKILVILALLLFIVALVLVILQSNIFRQSEPTGGIPETNSGNSGDAVVATTNTNIIIPEVPPGPPEDAVKNLLNPPSSQTPGGDKADPQDPKNSTFKETPGEHGTQPTGNTPTAPEQNQ